EYGFTDAFNETENWYAKSHLAIDQGPIIVMIENYRTGLLWKLFMSSPDIKRGLTKLGFDYSGKIK
nr:beta-glucosidase [Chitinophagaceae bacterium]